MENKYIKKHILISLVFGILFTSMLSCNKTLDGGDGTELANYEAINLDTNAGTWKTYVLAKPTEVPMTIAPVYTVDELNAVKTAVAKQTDDQKEKIKYWNGLGVLRWNQIMRSLVVKHNLAPNHDDYGSYFVPNAGDPDNLNGTGTTFPFSNPPYAARAYSNVSVAIYDALVAAKAYKNVYKRLAPNLTDNTIVPKGVTAPAGANSYSYPSEDAVMAGAAYVMLKALFPGSEDTTMIYNAKEEQKMHKLWAGATSKVDIAAGEQLGKSIALKVLARMKADGMAAANTANTKTANFDAIVKAQQDSALVNSGESVVWKSQELPERRGLLTKFGYVKTWNMNFSTMKNYATTFSKPYKMNSAEFKKDIAEVKSYSDNPTRENYTIVYRWADGTGTYAPPGHWNNIAESSIVDAKLSEVATAKALAILNTAMMDAAISCWYVKYYYWIPRPTQMDNSIKVLTGLPNFPAYVSGHSSFSGAAATVLSALFPKRTTEFQAMAKEASESRILGAIHYRMDCTDGLILGNKMGQFALDKF